MRLFEIEISFEDHPYVFRNFVFANSESEAWESGNRLFILMGRESEYHSFLPEEAEGLSHGSPDRLAVTPASDSTPRSREAIEHDIESCLQRMTDIEYSTHATEQERLDSEADYTLARERYKRFKRELNNYSR